MRERKKRLNGEPFRVPPVAVLRAHGRRAVAAAAAVAVGDL